MDRKQLWFGGALAASITAAVLVVTQPGGSPAPSAPGGIAAAGLGAVDPQMLAAMRRDLHLTDRQALDRLTKEDAATGTEQRLRAELAAGYGGAWLTGGGQQLVVAVTDAAGAARVRAAGAQPRMVARSEGTLNAVMAKLDAAPAPPSVISWHVDVATNQVLVRADPRGQAAARAFVQASGADPAAVRVERFAHRPRDEAEVIGGERLTVTGGSFCSIGLSVTKEVPVLPDIKGYLTAGHCGPVGANVIGKDGQAQGKIIGRTFPTSDHALVQVNANWTLRAAARGPGGALLSVSGARQAPVGASICHSGVTTGWRCGEILAHNVTLPNADQSTRGMSTASACSESGDSGGPYLTGRNAQGLHKGRFAPSCGAPGAASIYQPVLPALEAYGARLIFSGSAGTPPVISSMTCDRFTGRFSCAVAFPPDQLVISWRRDGTTVTAGRNKKVLSGTCTPGVRTSVRVSVSNTSGSDAKEINFPCTPR